MLANGGRSGKVPFTGIMLFKRLVCKYTRWTYFSQVAAERALQYAILLPAEIHMVMGAKYIQVIASRIIAVKPYAAVTLYTPVHFMMNERSQVLIGIGTFFKFKAPVIMPGHYRHVLQMAVASFIANGAVVRMIGHQPFNYLFPERFCRTIGNGYAQSILHVFHAAHYQAPAAVLLILKYLYRALPACAHTSHGRMPAEIGKIKTKAEAGFKQVFPCFYFIWLVININSRHDALVLIRTFFFPDMPVKILPVIFDSALQRFHSAGRQGAKSVARPKQLRMHLQQRYIIFLSLSVFDR